MGVLEKAREEFWKVRSARKVAPASLVVMRCLSADEAIGPQADEGFVIKKGREVVVEARCLDATGQAFTDSPMDFKGTLGEVVQMDLSEAGNRAILVATMNAVLRHLGLAEGTVHCRDEDPQRCGPEMAAAVEGRFGRKRYGLVGLQPSILAAMVQRFGPESVRVVDLNADNIGRKRSGILVWDGATDLARLVNWSEVLLVTGSSVVNGTMDGILERAERAGRTVVFFGNTISGVAAMAGLERICPFGQ